MFCLLHLTLPSRSPTRRRWPSQRDNQAGLSELPKTKNQGGFLRGFGRAHLETAYIKGAAGGAAAEDGTNQEKLGDAGKDVDNCATHFRRLSKRKLFHAQF